MNETLDETIKGFNWLLFEGNLLNFLKKLSADKRQK